MDAARQLKGDTIPFVLRAVPPSTALPLQISSNPFVAGANGSRMGRPLQKAYGEVIRHVGQQTPIVVVVGSAGTGKSLLVDMTVRACVDMGLTARRIERSDQVQTLLGTKSDVLLIDQTDSMSNSSLHTLLSAEGRNIATTMVFMCLPTCVGQLGFSDVERATIELTPLSLSDARNYLHERATSIGRTNLFTPEALDLVIDGSRGLPRLLRSIAHLAYWAAASEGAPQIAAQHVSNASGSQGVDHHADIDEPRTQIALENKGAEPDAKTELGSGVGNERPTQISDGHVADVAGANNSANQQHERAIALLHEVATKTRVKVPAPAPRPAMKESAPAIPVKEFRAAEERSAGTGVWGPRIAGALAASVAIGALVSFSFMGGKPETTPHVATARSTVATPVVAQPASLKPAAIPAPALFSHTAVPSQPRLAHKDAPAASHVTTKAVVQPARENPATEQAAAPKAVDNKVVENKAGAGADAAGKVAASSDSTPSSATEVQQPPGANDPAQQAAAQKTAEEQAAEERAVRERIDAAAQAFLLAQEAGKRAQAARDAAAQEQAAKEATARAKAQRESTNKQFSYSMLGVGR